MTSTISPTSGRTGLPPTSGRTGLPPTVEEARSAGRQLALGAAVPEDPSSPPSVEALVRAALPPLKVHGLHAELVRSRPNCVVVRSSTTTGTEAERGCAFMTAWLESLPWLVHRVPGSVVESTCATRGGHGCIHTLLWQAPRRAAATPPAPASPVAGGHVPVVPVVPTSNGHAPAVPAGAASVPTLPALAGSWVQRANGAFRAAIVGGRRHDDPPGSEAVRAPAPRAPEAASPVGRAVLASGADQTATAETATAAETTDAETATADLTTPATADRPAATEPRAWDDVVAMPARSRARRRTRGAWLRRRGWMLVLALMAGGGGGGYATAHHAASSSATTTLVVRSGASPNGPGSANDASALAVTDAALLGTDQFVITRVAGDLGLPTATVGRGLVVQAVAGTSLMKVTFSSSSPSKAVAGATDVATVLLGGQANQAIPAGSVAVVSLPKSATTSGRGLEKGLLLGAILGLVVGAAAVLAAERADRRVDDAETLSSVADCPVTTVPAGISPTELARSLERATGGRSVALVPLRQAQAGAAQQLAREVAGVAVPVGAERRPLTVTDPFAEAPDAVSGGTGPTILVVGSGERLRAVHEVVARLRLVERRPVWSVLVTG
ncbi:MAG: hypothetical protein ACRDYZ_05060 [Acidimicrobiales bacterium]